MTFPEVAQEVMKTKSMMLFRPRKGEPHQYDAKPYEGKKRGWAMLDTFTASAIVAVGNALSPENRAKMDTMNPLKLASFCLSHVR